MKNNKKYSSLTKDGSRLIANRDIGEFTLDVPSGIYTPHFDPMRNMFWLEEAGIMSDSILDLPSPAYQQVMNEMRLFMKPEKKAMFKKLGYVYKRSALLHGPPGVGKTILVQRVIADVLNKNGVVLYVKNPSILEIAYEVMKDVTPDIFTLVIFEEFDSIIPDFEATLLSLLDGEVQKDNVIYLATTNHLERIPARLRRPGRFASIIEVGYPTVEAREFYLNNKLKDKTLSKELASKTDGFSIDELKEVIQAHIILDQDFSIVHSRIAENRSIIYEEPAQDSGAGDYMNDNFQEELNDGRININLIQPKPASPKSKSIIMTKRRR